MIFNPETASGGGSVKTPAVIENFSCISYDPTFEALYFDSSSNEYSKINGNGPYNSYVGELVIIFITNLGPGEIGPHPSPVYNNIGYEVVFRDDYCQIMKITEPTSEFGLLIS